MKVVIDFHTNNASFGDSEGSSHDVREVDVQRELRRIFKLLGEQIATAVVYEVHTTRSILDSNGNTIGTLKVVP